MIPGKRYTPEELIALAWARKWVLLACIVTGAVSAYSGSLLVKNLYQSETLILVVPQKVPDEYVRPTITSRLGDRLRYYHAADSEPEQSGAVHHRAESLPRSSRQGVD